MYDHRPLALSVGLACAALAFSAPAPAAADPRADALAEIGHYRDQAHWLDALAVIERARVQSPDDELLYRLQVLTLSDIGNAHRAWQLYLARPDLFDAAQKERLEGNYLAKLVAGAWPTAPARTPAWMKPMRPWCRCSSTSSATAPPCSRPR